MVIRIRRRRKFVVKIGIFESRIYTASSGVPAGSILGPTLFLIGVNDIADCVVHADDIKLSMIIDSAEESRYLQMDINNVVEWSRRNRLPFNLKKCEVITISRRNEPHNAIYLITSLNERKKCETLVFQ